MLYLRERVVAIPSAVEGSEYSRWAGLRLPPLYSQYHQNELRLPQHHWHATSHEDEPKFFFVPGHSRGSGWGNIMQEILLNAYLAHKSNRAFVFYNYTWNDNPSEDYADYAGKPIPSRIPLSALVAGPLVGGAFPPGQHAPLAIAEEYYRTVCEGRKVVLDRDEMDKKARSWMVEPITTAWLEKLSTVDDQCVEVAQGQGPIYNWITFGDRHAMHDAWADFAASPIVTHFRWSALVELAFDNNREVIAPTAVFEPPLSTVPYTSNAERYTALAGLLVLHLRRGDYEGHCEHLAKWSSSYLAFNGLPALEQFDPPEGGSWGENTPENVAIYRAHCLPDIAQIVARVREVQRAGAARGLQHVYVMTNGAVEWVEELKRALRATGQFTHVASSRDLVLNWEQKYVAQAVDMLVGQRAQVFIGNGWSSLTGGIVVMRQANGFHPDTTRFF
ncbi:hypothetical protein BD311DRAFT_837218 [Dichomitus squalens]|uniref:Uncharacterized protein n=1 Tax=Dichomitus squalens TaxID=114155 RepID=A0A4Q9MS00_9APHY|nr:hypothetical protein BD311DRAFT_837218 [Dichomitus squalens]